MASSSAKTPSKKSDDLFEKSTMTFGEHLEELRRALAKAFVWLAIGMCAALLFADRIVKYIQQPLELALTEFYEDKAIHDWQKDTGEEMDQSLIDFMRTYKRVPTITYVNPDEIASAISDLKTIDDVKSTSNDPPKPIIDTSKKADTSKKVEASSDAQAAGTTGNSETPKATEVPPSLAEKEKDAAVQPVTVAEIEWLPKNFRADRLRPIRFWSKTATTTEALQMSEPFMIYIKASLMVGLILASPGIFWHIWSFVSAGLYPHERRYVFFFLPVSIGLFLGGAVLAFFFIFKIVLDFLLKYNASMGINPAPRLNDYMSFAMLLPLGFGVAFQLPVVMLILERIGVCSVKTYIAQWRWALLIIAFISMVLTPGDITPMIAMMIPLIGLYYLGIALCKYLPRGTAMGSRGYDVQ